MKVAAQHSRRISLWMGGSVRSWSKGSTQEMVGVEISFSW